MLGGDWEGRVGSQGVHRCNQKEVGSGTEENFLLISESFLAPCLLCRRSPSSCIPALQRENRALRAGPGDPSAQAHSLADKHFWSISYMPGTVLGCGEVAGNRTEPPGEETL